MKKFIYWLFAFLFLLSGCATFNGNDYDVLEGVGAARPDSKKTMYLATSLTGGGSGALDAFDITGAASPNTYDLVDGDSAIVSVISGEDVYHYFYIFDADGTDATDSPNVIRPNDYASAGVWRLTLLPSGMIPWPTTAAGDIMYHGATGVTRLAAGAQYSILAMGETYPEWVTTLNLDIVLGEDTPTNDGAIAKSTNDELVMGVDDSSTAYFSPTKKVADTLGDSDVHTISEALANDSFQPLDADLTTWAGITPGSNVGTFLATPSLANLFGAVTGEGTGVATAMGNAVDGASGLATYSHTVQYSATPVIDDPDNFATNFTGGNLYGGTFIANAAGTAALPDPAAGMNFTYVLEGANANIIDPLGTGTADTIYMNGLAAASDENITSSTSGAICYFQYRAANTWMATCVDFAEATPPE